MQPLPETSAALAALAVATDEADAALRRAVRPGRYDDPPHRTGVRGTDPDLRAGRGELHLGRDRPRLVPHSTRSSTSTAGRACTPWPRAPWSPTPTTTPSTSGRGTSSPRRALGPVCSSTLSIPLMSDGRVYGGLNLYGGTPRAFDGHHDELAELYGGWAGGAVTNADLSADDPGPGADRTRGCWPTLSEQQRGRGDDHGGARRAGGRPHADSR